MKKFWIGLAASALIVTSAGAGAWAATGIHKTIGVDYRNIKISVDGKTVNTGTDEPFVYNDRTYVPARYVAEALGAKVGWDQDTATVLVSSPSYLKVTTDGDYTIWSMPGQGFSIRAPKGFINQEMPTAALQLVLPDPATGLNSVVAVSKFDTPQDGSTLTQQVNAIITGLSQSFLPDAQVVSTTTATNQVTAQGTTTLFGKTPTNFTIRLQQAGTTTYMVMTMAPSSLAPQMTPVMNDILASFTVLQ